MEVFKIFATMSLVDAISKPLGVVKTALEGAGKTAEGVTARLGRLGMGLAKVAAPCAVFLGGLTALTLEAAAFESKMADVDKILNFQSPAELEAMSRSLQDLSLRVPIAAEGFADIAAAAASSVEEADLLGFAEQAAKMGVAFDVAAGDASRAMVQWGNSMGLPLTKVYALGDAVNHLSNKMKGVQAADLVEVLNRAGAGGQLAGLAAEQVAAMGGAVLSTGASAEVAATGLNAVFNTLTSGANMTDSQAAAFKTLGVDVANLSKNMQTDAQGAILGVLTAIKALPADRVGEVLEAAFGTVGKRTLAPMIANLDNLRGAFGLVGDAAGYAGSMQEEYASRSATTENSIQLMKNSFNVLAITVGGYFLPVLDAAAKGVGAILRALIAFSRTPAGGFLLKLAAGFAAAVTGAAGLSLALAAIQPVLALLGAVLAPVLGPILAIGAAVALVAVAWQNDFGGIATTLTAFWGKAKLVVEGVLALFGTLSGGKGKMSAELARKIEAAGLMGLVTTVARTVYRVVEFFKGVGRGIKATLGPAFDYLSEAYGRLGEALSPLFGLLGELAEYLGLAAGESESECWAALGEVLGTLVSVGLSLVVRGIGLMVDIAGVAIKVIVKLINWLKPYASKLLAVAAAVGITIAAVASGLGPLLLVVAAVAAVGAALFWAGGKLMDFGAWAGDALFSVAEGVSAALDSIMAFGQKLVAAVVGAVTSAVEAIKNFDLLAAGQALIDGFCAGVTAGAEGLVSAVTGVLSRVRALLPFSDAATGPLSDLTASGLAFIQTWGQGIASGAGWLFDKVSGILGKIRGLTNDSDAKYGPLSDLTASGRAFPATLGAGIAAGAPALYSATEKMLAGAPMASPLGFGSWGGEAAVRHSFNRQEGGEMFARRPAELSEKPGNRTVTLHIGRIELPGVQDAQGFVAALEAIAAEKI